MNEIPIPDRLHQEDRHSGLKRPIVELIFALEREEIAYCHWKSNCRLDDTLAGNEDIDLLVDRRDAAAFESALSASGFKLAQSRLGTGHPAVFHAIGLDEAASRLVDLHACYQIIGGDSLVKNYRMAVEASLLTHTRYLRGVKVPMPEAELALFALRTALKHVSPIEILKSNLNYKKTSRELLWLREVADIAKAEAQCAAWFPAIKPELFRQILDAIENDRAILRRMTLGWRVAFRMRGLRRLGSVPAAASRLWRLLILLWGRMRRRRDLSLQTGGMIIALVGPKATGKSTIAGALAASLGRYLDTVHIHAGKPPASVLSWIPNFFMPAARWLLPHERLSEYESAERRRKKDYSLLYVVRMTLLAYDRRKLLRRALRQAAAGTVVISDRYPSEIVGAIDSSCFDDAAIEQCGSRLKRWLMRKERALYRGLPRPGLVIRLVAPMETALLRDAHRRKPGGPDADAVRRRWELENYAQFPGTSVIDLDTARPLDDTLRNALSAVWAAL